MSKNLALLIKLYLQHVAFGMDLFYQSIGNTNPLKAWHSGQITRTGNLTQNVQYELHGGGGTFLLNDDYLVDFDFHSNGQYDGFDLWRLKQFVHYSCDDRVGEIYQHIKELEADFNQAIMLNKIAKIENSTLFRLANPN